MQRAIEAFAAINFLVIGLSHIVQPRAWAEFFIWLRAKGAAGSFVNGFLSLSLGALVVGFHNVWTGIPVVLTVIGWGQLLKAVIAFIFPKVGLKSMARVTLENARMFVFPGVLFVLIGGLLVFHLVTSTAPA
ncbi:MAG TPA: hypothetical protein VEX86_19020 [Longimicrobium sp.]|nr:hypothetical protein [Longimicrobium sp.]